jgi:outer membrane protein assembly factor BamB
MRMLSRWTTTIAMVAALQVSMAANAGDEASASAEKILGAAGVKGGIVVHLGCGGGELTAALRVNDSFVVHGLEPDPLKVAEAREHIVTQGLYGPVSVEEFAGAVLPYADNLVNLLVVEDPGAVSREEIMRVLVPNGVACVKREGAWRTTTKPRPDNIDEWPHFLGDAGNNAVARDEVVGPPRRLQWIAPPLWLRSHETPTGIQGQVCAGGRLFYIFDEGLIGITDERLPDRWSLICRDAFNGALLWKRPIEPWGWREWSREKYEGKDWTTLRAARKDLPNTNERRLAARGDRLYATLGFGAPLSILDAATGDVLTTVEETGAVDEILVSAGTVVVCSNSVVSEDAQRRKGAKTHTLSTVAALDGETGKILWNKKTSGLKPMSLAVEGGRVVFLAGKDLVCLDLKDGDEIWRTPMTGKAAGTLVANSGTVLLKGGGSMEAYDAETGKQLWSKKPAEKVAGENADLFVADGLVWGGVKSVDDDRKPARKSDGVLAIGLDPRTGEVKKEVFAPNLRSPEHHHRCYRNKATDRYVITGMEGAEFLDLRSDNHSQNNFVRGACDQGIMPCNGMLYVPADQCFCHPASKLLGYAAIGPESAYLGAPIANNARLEKGPAYAEGRRAKSEGQSGNDWPTFRHDPARSGATQSSVPSSVASQWRVKLGGNLTAPVASGGKIFVASRDAHTIHALDMKTGETVWTYIAGGRVDSPPTIHEGLALFGSKDGRVYCLRASDGELVWRFTAAPYERRIAYFDQIESAWPVHGSVLVSDGVAYVTAGRSTYLDGGIRVYGLNPATGEVLHQGVLEGPYADIDGEREYSFYTLGANSDVLVAEGGLIYMRQKAMAPQLEEASPDVLSSKGEMDVGLHVFSTSSLLDDSWYNRAFWMYSKRWPGFQLANQAPKAGQLLVVGEEATYALRVFYRRNVHSPMFSPGKEGYLVFADKNTNEPQIVGEEGARKPVEWLPQSSYSTSKGIRELDSPAFGLDKMIGYTRAEPPLWTQWLPVRVRAMVKAGDTLFAAGPPDVFDADDPYAAFEGRKGGRLVALSTKSGEILTEMELDSPPIFDGLIAADGRLFVTLRDGSLMCLE